VAKRPTPDSKREATISIAHFEWAVSNRAANQLASIKLLDLMRKHPEEVKSATHGANAQRLVAVAFSLWRAVFLADKAGVRKVVIAQAQQFLEKLITDNAIAFAQDRASREWTFNYYMNASTHNLLFLAKTSPAVRNAMSAESEVLSGQTNFQRRWERNHNAFKIALDEFEIA
jgi:hypothetical protein